MYEPIGVSKGITVTTSQKSPWLQINNRGLTLFEMIVAVMLLGMIATMIYSVLNVGIKFSDKGEKAIQRLARQHGVLNLIYRQVTTAYYDSIKKEVIISGDSEILRVVTRSPLRYRDSGVALAVYRYDPAGEALYYLEKRDYYNIDYDDEYQPSIDEMLLLAEKVPSISFEVDEESALFTLTYGEQEFTILPRCADIDAVEGDLLPQ